MSGVFGELSVHSMAKRGQVLLGLGQALLSSVMAGRRVGDEQDTLGAHGRRLTYLTDPVAGDGLQVTVAVGLLGVWGEMNPLKFTDGAL